MGTKLNYGLSSFVAKVVTAVRLQSLVNFWGGRGNVDTVKLRVLIDDAP